MFDVGRSMFDVPDFLLAIYHPSRFSSSVLLISAFSFQIFSIYPPVLLAAAIERRPAPDKELRHSWLKRTEITIVEGAAP